MLLSIPSLLASLSFFQLQQAIGINAVQVQQPQPQVHLFSSSSSPTSKQRQFHNTNSLPRIAIIGAGSAGSSAAFFLKQRSVDEPGGKGLETRVTVFEKERDRVGGRTGVVRVFDDKLLELGAEDGDDEDEGGLPRVEAGASIFVPPNRILFKATKQPDPNSPAQRWNFNLSTRSQEELEPGKDSDEDVGIWDGREFVVRTGGWGSEESQRLRLVKKGRGRAEREPGEERSLGGLQWFGKWWDKGRMLLRYGLSPVISLPPIVSRTVDAFVSIYSSDFVKLGPFEKWEEMVRSGELGKVGGEGEGFEKLLTTSCLTYFTENKINKRFTSEVVGAGTRVNYAQDPSLITALGALVTLSASEALQVVGGNYHIMKSFLSASEADLRLGQGVKRIEKALVREKGSEVVQWKVTSIDGRGGEKVETFDAVVLACPLGVMDPPIEFVNIDLPKSLDADTSSPSASPSSSSSVTFRSDSPPSYLIPPMPFIHLHVTILTTNASRPTSEYFSKEGEDGRKPPRNVYVTWEGANGDERKTGKTHGEEEEEKRKLEFNSLGYIRSIPLPLSPNITSKMPIPNQLTGSELNVLKFFSNTPLSDEKLEEILGKGNVGWVFRKEWDSYTILEPLDHIDGAFAPARLDDDGLYYSSGFERAISTMETAAVAAENTISLLLKDLFGYKSQMSWADWKYDDEQEREEREL